MKYTFLVGIVLALSLSVLAFQQVEALAILKIQFPHKNGDVMKANQTITVRGTSMQPNATAIKCNVQMQMNQAGYNVTTPLGTGSHGPYTNWTAVTPPLTKGVNSIEAQLQCFGNGNGISFTKHLVRNVTAA